jgi:hypothetical protein
MPQAQSSGLALPEEVALALGRLARDSTKTWSVPHFPTAAASARFIDKAAEEGRL